MNLRIVPLFALVPACAPWVFQSLDRDCEGVDNVVAITSSTMDVFHRASTTQLPFATIDDQPQCWVSAEGEGRPPTFSQTALALRVEEAQQVYVFGQQRLAVSWGPEARLSTVENELGIIRGSGSATMNFDPSSATDTVRIECDDCNVQLRIPEGVGIGRIQASNVALCLDGYPRVLPVHAQRLQVEFSGFSSSPQEAEVPPDDEPWLLERTLPCWP